VGSLKSVSHGNTHLLSELVPLTSGNIGNTFGHMAHDWDGVFKHVTRDSVGESRSIWVLVEPLFDLAGVVLESWAVDQVSCHVWGDVDNHKEGILNVLDLGVEWHPEVGGSFEFVNGLIESVLGTWDNLLALIHLTLEINVHESINITEVNLFGLIQADIDIRV